MEWLGSVSTEGGPLLIAERDVIVHWNGADYRRACELLDRSPELRGFQLDVAGKPAVVWDMPAGTADVWGRGPGSLVLTFSALDTDDLGARQSLADLPTKDPVPAGTVKVESGWLVIMWAADDGNEIAGIMPYHGLALDLSVGESGIILQVLNGTYTVYTDEVADGAASARRALIVDRAIS